MMKKTHLTLALALLSAKQTDATGWTDVSVVDVLAAEPQAAGGVPEWIKISPRGAFTTRDGRSFSVDPEGLVARFNAEGVKIPMDLDHATAKKALFGDAAPALGWIEELSARSDGLYGRVDWLDEGRKVLSARTHRYVSPAFPHSPDGRVSYLHSAALVAAPALSMPAVASAGANPTENPMLKAIAKALGLNEEASEAACLSAISDLFTRIDPAVHQQTVATLSAVQAELNTIKATSREKEIGDLLEGALKAKKITPAQRDHYATLCATDEGLKSVKQIFETLGAMLPASGLDNKDAPGGVATLSAEDRDVMKMMGLTEKEYREANGLTAA